LDKADRKILVTFLKAERRERELMAMDDDELNALELPDCWIDHAGPHGLYHNDFLMDREEIPIVFERMYRMILDALGGDYEYQTIEELGGWLGRRVAREFEHDQPQISFNVLDMAMGQPSEVIE
jgi:hypothetical protein